MTSLTKKLSQLAIIAFLCALLCITMTGCLPAPFLDGDDDDRPSAERHHYESDTHHYEDDGHRDWGLDSSDDAARARASFPGTYDVPEDWVVSKKHSNSRQTFYIEEGDESEALPDNVAVSTGTNRYAKEDHASFREAILRQLSAQIGDSSAQVLGSGETTPAGDVLYVFTVKEDDCTTTFYYVVGDYEFCLFQATDFDDSDDASEAAREMANSFSWR